MAQCCGKALTVRNDGHTASVTEQQAVPGMPKYKVTGSDEGDQEFTTYIAARNFKNTHGGKLRAT